MAFSSGSGRGPQADINVTPLVDIVLVLLIIFMVITPMLNEGANVTLPKAHHTEVAKDDEEQPTTISVTKDGAIWLGKEQLTAEQLETEILTVILGDPRAAIVIKGDGQTRYADVRVVMKVLENVGAKGVRLQADQAKADAPEQEG